MAAQRSTSRVVTLAGVAAVAVLATACTSSGTPSNGPAPIGASSTLTGSPVTPSGSAPGGSGTGSTGTGSTGGSQDAGGQSGSAQNGAAQCAESQLRATINATNPIGPGHSAQHPVIVYFRNTSSSTCTLSGYPGAAIVDSNGKQVQQAARTLRGNVLGLAPGDDTIPVVRLSPGDYASAGLEGVSTREAGAAQAGCDATYPRILVTPPNTAVAVPFNVTWPLCFTFTVHPVNVEKNPPR